MKYDINYALQLISLSIPEINENDNECDVKAVLLQIVFSLYYFKSKVAILEF